MNVYDFIIIGLIAAMVIMALKSLRKNRGTCSCCNGRCGCSYCPKNNH